MSAAKTQITPSTEARRLFGRMVARSSDGEHLPLARTIELSVHRMREGYNAEAQVEVDELQAAFWISPADDGGWRLTGD